MTPHARPARTRRTRRTRRGGVSLQHRQGGVNPQHRWGGVYPMVLIVSAAAATAALTGLAVRSATDQRTQTTADLANTRLAARSGIEAVLQITSENNNWRTELSSGKTFSYAIDGATVDVILSDENDADLADSATDPYTLTSVATTNDATTTLRVTVTPIADTYRQRVIDEGPLYYWPLDETSGFVADDLVDNANAGHTNPGTLNRLTGYDGLPAAQMDAASSVSFTPHRSDMDLSEATVMCWVYCHGDTAGNQAIIMKSAGDMEVGDFELFFSDSDLADDIKLELRVIDEAKAKENEINIDKVLLDTWTHIAVVFKGPTIYCFIDGVLVKEKDIPYSWSSNTHPMQFGVAYKSIFPSEPVNGSVRDVVIFDSALSGGKISDLIEGSVKAFGIEPDAWAWIAN